MKNLDMKMINVEQLNVVAGGGMDENEGFFYQEGTVTDMGGRTAFVKIDHGRETECTYDHNAEMFRKLRIGCRVRVRWPERHIYMVIE